MTKFTVSAVGEIGAVRAAGSGRRRSRTCAKPSRCVGWRGVKRRERERLTSTNQADDLDRTIV